MIVWLSLIREQVETTADEEFQRQTWFGIGPYVDSPDERFNKFLGDASVEEFLRRDNTGLTLQQLESLGHLTKLMRALCDSTPSSIDQAIGPSFIADPRWKEIINAAKRTEQLLSHPEDK